MSEPVSVPEHLIEYDFVCPDGDVFVAQGQTGCCPICRRLGTRLPREMGQRREVSVETVAELASEREKRGRADRSIAVASEMIMLLDNFRMLNKRQRDAAVAALREIRAFVAADARSSAYVEIVDKIAARGLRDAGAEEK